MTPTPLRKISHEVDDFTAAAMYGGGTNVINDARWGLWDYGGTQAPESNCALILTMTPLDGSNNGKEHTEYWNVGSSKDYRPVEDGAFMSGTHEASQSCNAFQFMKYLQDNCGMERGRLSQDGIGVKALIGSEITFARVPDQRDRSGLQQPIDPATGQPRAQQKPKDILVPMSARFSWETGTKKNNAKPATKTATTATPAAAAKASSNGTGDPLPDAIIAALNAADGALELPELVAKVTEQLTVTGGVSVAKRITLLKSIKAADGSVDPDKLAALSDKWTVDTNDGVIALA